jgi:hypothetical protein
MEEPWRGGEALVNSGGETRSAWGIAHPLVLAW